MFTSAEGEEVTVAEEGTGIVVGALLDNAGAVEGT